VSTQNESDFRTESNLSLEEDFFWLKKSVVSDVFGIHVHVLSVNQFITLTEKLSYNLSPSDDKSKF
jgi:hypothetical protein